MNKSAEAVVDWTRGQLDAGQLRPPGRPAALGRGGEEVCLVHASADQPADWTYVSEPLRAEQSLAAARATYVFSGHVHEQALYYQGAGGRPATSARCPGWPSRCRPGAAGWRWSARPASRATATPPPPTRSSTTRPGTLTFHRVPYEWAKAAAKIRAAGLPEALASRLERGE